jgi:hypothetical protein
MIDIDSSDQSTKHELEVTELGSGNTDRFAIPTRKLLRPLEVSWRSRREVAFEMSLMQPVS